MFVMIDYSNCASSYAAVAKYGFACDQNLLTLTGKAIKLSDFCCATCTTTGKACKQPQYQGDTRCDDENNNKQCNWDGGDCCYKTVSGGKLNTKYCKQVPCEGFCCSDLLLPDHFTCSRCQLRCLFECLFE